MSERKVALITGAAGGIGAAVAARLAHAGAALVLADRDEEGATRVANTLGGDVRVVACDQTDGDQVDDLFSGLDQLDLCFANAGWARVDPFLELPADVWRRCMDVNVTGTFLICQGAARMMAAGGRGGAMVVTASTGAIRPAAQFAGYCTAKAALNMLVQVMAYELGAYGIRVNAVMPGVTETPMTKVLLDSGARDQVNAETPMGRTGRPDDIAAAVAYLLSDDSSYVTGTSLLVDGGSTMGSAWFGTDFRQRGAADWKLRHELWPVGVADAG